VGADFHQIDPPWECGKLPRDKLPSPKGRQPPDKRLRQFVAIAAGIFFLEFDFWIIRIKQVGRRQNKGGDMNGNLQVQQEEGDEFPALLVGTGLALASLILLPALAQRVGLGASVTIALRSLLMRAANRA
jgi:hypothetical protein